MFLFHEEGLLQTCKMQMQASRPMKVQLGGRRESQWNENSQKDEIVTRKNHITNRTKLLFYHHLDQSVAEFRTNSIPSSVMMIRRRL